MKKPQYMTSNGIPLAFSNLWYGQRCSIVEIQDAVEDSKNGAELAKRLNSLDLFNKFTVDRETEAYARLKCIDCWGNVQYFKAYK